MKRIYDFSRKPAHRNYTVSDLKELKNSPKKLTMSNPANEAEIKACVQAGIDLFVIGPRNIEDLRSVAPSHFTGVGSKCLSRCVHQPGIDGIYIQTKK